MKYVKYLDKLESIEGKIFIVTGANSGLGYQTTLDLVYKKARVIMACRNVDKAQIAKEKILLEVKDAKLDIYRYDQGNFNSIDKFVNDMNKNFDHIDGLVCNAGVYYPKANYMTADGFELTFGTNYLGTYYLLKKINPLLEKSKAKVVIVTSLTGALSSRKTKIEDNEKLGRNKIYGFSKYCLSRLCYELDQKSENVEYYLTHPGICQTNIISSDQTGLPSFISKAGHYFLYVFVHHANKACLTNLLALSSNEKDKKFIKPRGLFAISGLPIQKKYPKYAKKPIIEESENYIKEKARKLK